MKSGVGYTPPTVESMTPVPWITADGPDQPWVADITYGPTWAGFLYLAVVLDAWSRRIVGWAMATHLRTELVLDATKDRQRFVTQAEAKMAVFDLHRPRLHHEAVQAEAA